MSRKHAFFHWLSILLLSTVLLLGPVGQARADFSILTRASVASNGTEANDISDDASVSADGRFVAFRSYATNLVPGDTNGYSDTFVHDRQTGETTRVSIASDGTEADGHSYAPTISGNGRFVAFYSYATNLVSGDTNGVLDIFVHDRQTGETTRVSVASDGTEGNDTSDDPTISADGRFVAFRSDASNLVPGDTNGFTDIFVHDRQTGETTRVSIASDGTEANGSGSAPNISANGRFVAFYSYATNLVPGDTNSETDIFVHDRQTGETTRVSVASDGTEANNRSDDPSLSADGRFVVFRSHATNLVPGDTNEYSDIFVHDRQTGETKRISMNAQGAEGNEESDSPSISADGRVVVFPSDASNLVPGDTNNRGDVFVYALIPNAFADVPDDHWAMAYINRLYLAGITEGCASNPLQYCPQDEVTRAQMAVFLLRGMHYPDAYSPPDVAPSFPDTAGHWAEDWIEALKAAGITTGYPDGTYRPNDPVTRAQMAVFLLRATHGPAYQPPTVGHSSFNDVPDDHWAKDWIEQLAVEGIATGYPDGGYHPDQTVTRAEMAALLVKAFGLP